MTVAGIYSQFPRKLRQKDLMYAGLLIKSGRQTKDRVSNKQLINGWLRTLVRGHIPVGMDIEDMKTISCLTCSW